MCKIKYAKNTFHGGNGTNTTTGASSNSLASLANLWYDAINANYANVTSLPANKLLKLLTVTKTSNTYTLNVEIPNTLAPYSYYWVKNDAGINSALSITASNNSPAISAVNGDRLMAYVKDANGKFFASQPYIVVTGCKRCRDGSANISLSTNSLNYVSSGESKTVSIIESGKKLIISVL